MPLFPSNGSDDHQKPTTANYVSWTSGSLEINFNSPQVRLLEANGRKTLEKKQGGLTRIIECSQECSPI